MRVVVLSRVLFKPDGLEIILIHCLEYWFLSTPNFLYGPRHNFSLRHRCNIENK